MSWKTNQIKNKTGTLINISVEMAYSSTDDESYIPADDLLTERSYIILTKDEIRERQEEEIANVMEVLTISKEHAFILLKYFKWEANKLLEEWSEDEAAVLKAVGLLETQVELRKDNEDEMKCEICSKNDGPTEIFIAPWGHGCCFACWQGYIGDAINDGQGCLNLRCPSCPVVITQDMINELAKDEDKQKYAQFVLRSYVEDNYKKIKWCPSPVCDFAIEFLPCNGNYDVSCECSFTFCSKCSEEAHRPVNCDTVAKWMNNIAESEKNYYWLLVNIKHCPKCKRPIEKYGGGHSIQMICAEPCNYKFCWSCLKDWNDHEVGTYNFDSCVIYESEKNKGSYDEAERKRERAENSLDLRFTYYYYYECWSSNQSSWTTELKNLKEMKTRKIAELSTNIREPETNLKFILEAWQQIVECRRVLKWTCAYGYYLLENEVTKREFLKNLQVDAKSNLELLHTCAETELQNFFGILNPVQASQDFRDFRIKLTHLTRVTKKYFANLVSALENGLEGVNPSNIHSIAGVTGEDYWACEKCTSFNRVGLITCQHCKYCISYC